VWCEKKGKKRKKKEKKEETADGDKSKFINLGKVKSFFLLFCQVFCGESTITIPHWRQLPKNIKI